jgi:hypothetical protein
MQPKIGDSLAFHIGVPRLIRQMVVSQHLLCAPASLALLLPEPSNLSSIVRRARRIVLAIPLFFCTSRGALVVFAH